jgi:hypothetical protein
MGENERIHGDEDYVAEQERAAAEEAVEAGGGPVMSDEADESERALAEAGQGESEGFELAEEELIENASHEADAMPDPTLLAGDLAGEGEAALPPSEYAEADTEESEEA